MRIDVGREKSGVKKKSGADGPGTGGDACQNEGLGLGTDEDCSTVPSWPVLRRPDLVRLPSSGTGPQNTNLHGRLKQLHRPASATPCYRDQGRMSAARLL